MVYIDDILTQRKKRNTLQKPNVCDRMSVYLSHGKGGYDACYGRVLNSRGGSTETESVNGFYPTTDTTQTLDSIQDRWIVANHTRRSSAVSRLSAQHQTREKLILITGKLLSLPVAPGPVDFQAASPGVYLRWSIESHHVYCMSYDAIWQRRHGRVESVCIMSTTTTIGHTSGREVTM